MATSVHPARREGGFTLVEVLIAFSILAIVIGSCFAALNQGYRMQETSRMATIGAEIMQNEIENLRNMIWTEFAALPGSATLTIPDSFGAAGARFSGTRTISTVRANETGKVVIELSWTTPGHHTHTRRVSTYISKNGRAFLSSTSSYNDFSDDEETLW